MTVYTAYYAKDPMDCAVIILSDTILHLRDSVDNVMPTCMITRTPTADVE